MSFADEPLLVDQIVLRRKVGMGIYASVIVNKRDPSREHIEIIEEWLKETKERK